VWVWLTGSIFTGSVMLILTRDILRDLRDKK
jgi:hypothetical protein